MRSLGRTLGLLIVGLTAGCGGPRTEPERVWGQRGVKDGDFIKPRAVAIDSHDRLVIVDFTARVQVFDRDGNYLNQTWTTEYRNGRPSGLSIDRDGNILLSDSHYHCLRVFSWEGRELRKIGGEVGQEPGQFGYISDAVQDADGNFYISEFGINERITKLDASGKFTCWGGPGKAPGEFCRIRALALGPDGNLYVADACNHRIQVFTRDGERVRCFGTVGSGPGELRYPYDLAFSPKGELYVVEYGNERIQKFTLEGQSLGTWGGSGREPGRLWRPWALAVDSKGRVHVIDSENHRVQVVRGEGFSG